MRLFARGTALGYYELDTGLYWVHRDPQSGEVTVHQWDDRVEEQWVPAPDDAMQQILDSKQRPLRYPRKIPQSLKPDPPKMPWRERLATVDRHVELRARMNGLHLTTETLAEALDVNRSTVAHWLAGTRTPPPGIFTDLDELENHVQDQVRSLVEFGSMGMDALAAGSGRLVTIGVPASFSAEARLEHVIAARGATELRALGAKTMIVEGDQLGFETIDVD